MTTPPSTLTVLVHRRRREGSTAEGRCRRQNARRADELRARIRRAARGARRLGSAERCDQGGDGPATLRAGDAARGAPAAPAPLLPPAPPTPARALPPPR